MRGTKLPHSLAILLVTLSPLNAAAQQTEAPRSDTDQGSTVPPATAEQSMEAITPVTTAAPSENIAASPVIAAPAGTLVTIALSAELSSNVNLIDETFPITLAEPLVVNGATILPAGISGGGQVVHAAKSKALGKGGELIIAARYLQCGDRRIPLRGYRLSGAGTDKGALINGAFVVAGVLATPFMFLSGGKFVLPVGALGSAKLAEDITEPLSCETAAAPAEAEAPAPASPPSEPQATEPQAIEAQSSTQLGGNE